MLVDDVGRVEVEEPFPMLVNHLLLPRFDSLIAGGVGPDVGVAGSVHRRPAPAWPVAQIGVAPAAFRTPPAVVAFISARRPEAAVTVFAVPLAIAVPPSLIPFFFFAVAPFAELLTLPYMVVTIPPFTAPPPAATVLLFFGKAHALKVFPAPPPRCLNSLSFPFSYFFSPGIIAAAVAALAMRMSMPPQAVAIVSSEEICLCGAAEGEKYH